MSTTAVPKIEGEALTKLHVFSGAGAVEEAPNPHRLARKARLQLLLPEASVDRLEALKDATDATSHAEVIRRSLRIYEGLLAEAGAGGVLFMRRSDDSEVVVPLHRAL